ncbi:MAG: bacterial Ig-like domain-containing protein [Paludibacteraceae bacterium]|nr:bacterial Ig-like domain-containing protein [Paludibacteraceae bacterium]
MNVTFYTEATKTLSSITISGTPDKVTYEAGEFFDPTGLVATGYYDNSTNADLTSSVEWAYTPAGALTQGLTSVNVTATKGAIVGNKDVDITVNAHVVTPDEYEIPTNNALWGTSFNGNAGVTTLSGTSHDISITINKNTGSGMYVNDAQTRIYNGYTMVFSVPSGYVITAIQFTADGNNWAGEHTADVGTMTDNKNWSGSSNTVTISIAGTCRMTGVTVTFEAEAADAPSVTVDPTEVDATAEAANGLIDVTYTNITTASATVGLFNDAECNEAFTGGWLTASLNGDKDIAYTLTENTGAARTAYIKLTAPASNGTSPDVVKIIEVSQAKGIPTYTALKAIFDAATGTDETVKVTFNNWVISALRGTANAYLTDGTYGLIIYTEGHGFNVGDVLSGTVQTTLTKFQGNAELKGVTATSDGLTVSTGGTISARVLDAAGAAELTGANAGSLIKISGECTEPTTGRYYINGIQLYNSLYSYETPTVGDVYDCTGIFVMYNSYKEILPRQDGDLVPSAVTPTAIITFEDFSIEKGQNTTLAATVAPAVAASAEVTYSIVDGGEYVSLAGAVLSATEVGTAHIRATVADGTGYNGNTKDITVTVTAPDSRYTAIIDGITAINGTLVTETAGAHKDKEYISYAAQKGNASNAPIIPSGKSFVRIYQNGGYLALNAVKGCLIDEVIVSIPSTCNSTTIAVGTDEENLPTTGGTAATAGNDFSTGTGLNSQNVYLVCLGTTSSTRLEVGSITVKYTGDPVEVSSIALSGTYQTEFEKNAVFDHTGVVVTATYSDASEADVTALAEFSDPDMTTLGAKTVTVSYGGKSTTYDIEVVAATLTEIALSGTYPTRFHVGDAFSHTGMTVTASYSDYSEEDVTASAIFSGYDMSVAGAQTVTVEFGGQSAEYQIIVVPENTDVLTADLIGVEGTSYADWSDKTGFGTSSVYAGNSTNGSGANAGAIQLRYNVSDEAKQAGIILTGSNGMVLKGFSVTVKSGSNTLNVYGKNTAYTSRLDLYSEDEATRGKLIGTVSATGALTLEEGVSYDDNYQYIGMRSNSGALYLSSIMITWGDATSTPTKDVIRDGLSNGKWGTICPKQTVENVEGAVFYQITYLEEKDGMPYNVVFDEILGPNLEAGKPYFFIANAKEIRGNKTGAVLDAADPAGVNGFYGYIGASSMALPYKVDYDVNFDNTFVIYNNSVYRINGETELKSERCYININATEPIRSSVAPSPVRRRITVNVSETNATTGFGQINSSDVPVKMIIDGKMYILRGEKLFDATGRLVK